MRRLKLSREGASVVGVAVVMGSAMTMLLIMPMLMVAAAVVSVTVLRLSMRVGVGVAVTVGMLRVFAESNRPEVSESVSPRRVEVQVDVRLCLRVLESAPLLCAMLVLAMARSLVEVCMRVRMLMVEYHPSCVHERSRAAHTIDGSSRATGGRASGV